MEYDRHDPVSKLLADEEAADHARAKARGARIMDITRIVLGALDGHGLVRDQEQARIVIWSALADALYGNVSVDVPQLQHRD